MFLHLLVVSYWLLTNYWWLISKSLFRFEGFAAAPLWSAKCSYLTTSGLRYATLTGQDGDAVVTRFFGIFFLIFQSGQIWGNLISSLVLQPKGECG